MTHRAAKSVLAVGLAIASGAALAEVPRSALSLVTQTDLASRDNRAREPFYFQVAQPLIASGRVIVPTGSIAVGEIVTVGRSGRFARKGEMAVRLLYVSAPAGRMNLSAADGALVKVDRRDGLLHSTQGRIRTGTPVTAYLSETPKFGQVTFEVAAR